MRVLGPEEREEDEAAGAEDDDAEGMVGGEGAGTGPVVAGAAVRFGAMLCICISSSFISGRMELRSGLG